MCKLTCDEQMFIENLFDEMYRTLFFAAKAEFGNNELADEAVQETFRIACNKIDKIMASPNKAGWLILTLKNTINNIKRGRQRLANLVLQVTDIEGIANELSYNVEDDPDVLYANIADTEEYKLIKKLVFDKYEISELAEEYGITLDNCRQKIYRARIKLQKKLKETKKVCV